MQPFIGWSVRFESTRNLSLAQTGNSRLLTERVDDAGENHTCDGKRIGDFDAGDETMKTANGVHPEPAFPVGRDL